MKEKFTQGEWLASHSRNHYVVHARLDNISTFLCELDYCSNSERNALLIAAAPNGFELGLLVMELCGQPHGIDEQQADLLYETALSFIKKAQGENNEHSN